MKQLRLYHLKQITQGMIQHRICERGSQVKKNINGEAAAKLYRSGKGRMGVPMQNIIGALIAAGRHITNKAKKKVSTAKSTTLFDFLDFRTDFCEFDGCDEKGNIKWTPFVLKYELQGVNGHIALPRIPHWSLTVPVIFNSDREINEKTVDELFEIAGRKIGLCDWRPAMGNRFGRFVIEKVEVTPIDN